METESSRTPLQGWRQPRRTAYSPKPALHAQPRAPPIHSPSLSSETTPPPTGVSLPMGHRLLKGRIFAVCNSFLMLLCESCMAFHTKLLPQSYWQGASRLDFLTEAQCLSMCMESYTSCQTTGRGFVGVIAWIK